MYKEHSSSQQQIKNPNNLKPIKTMILPNTYSHTFRIEYNNNFKQIKFQYNVHTKIKQLVHLLQQILNKKYLIYKTGNINFDYLFQNRQQMLIHKLNLKMINIIYVQDIKPIIFKKNAFDEIKIIKLVGEGGFSNIYLAQIIGIFFALKLFKKHTSQDLQYLKVVALQINILKKLCNPFLPKLYLHFQTQNYVAMGIQYCTGGDLFEILKNTKRLSEMQAQFYFLQILACLQYLHSNKLIYFDLKPQNVVIDYDGHIKLIDFHSSLRIQQKQQYKQLHLLNGIYHKIIAHQSIDLQIDFFLLGVLLFQMVTGNIPFYSKDPIIFQQNIRSKKIEYPADIVLSIEFKSLIQGLIIYPKYMRLGRNGVNQILNHEWIRDKNLQKIIKKELIPPFINVIFEYKSNTQWQKSLKRIYKQKKVQSTMQNITSYENEQINFGRQRIIKSYDQNHKNYKKFKTQLLTIVQSNNSSIRPY